MDTVNNFNVGQWLFENRTRRGLSQFDVGTAIGYADGSSISRFENSWTIPLPYRLEALEGLFGSPFNREEAPTLQVLTSPETPEGQELSAPSESDVESEAHELPVAEGSRTTETDGQPDTQAPSPIQELPTSTESDVKSETHGLAPSETTGELFTQQAIASDETEETSSSIASDETEETSSSHETLISPQEELAGVQNSIKVVSKQVATHTAQNTSKLGLYSIFFVQVLRDVIGNTCTFKGIYGAIAVVFRSILNDWGV
jgi:transcriptional regulator with XRE-family HTH domain